MTITINHYLIVSLLLFGIGFFGVLVRRNVITVLMSIELMLNAVNIMMVSFACYVNTHQPLAGQIFAIFVMTVAAAEAAVGLAIVITVYRLRNTIQVDEIDLLKG